MAANSELFKAYHIADERLSNVISENDIYAQFINAIKTGSADFNVKRREISRIIDEEWIETIEKSLPSLDIAIRHPSAFIEDKERVLPIEQSRNITNRSLRHLSQHTDYISHIEGDMIIPSKILNVIREETKMTYENKFINTLIQRLYIFVNRRYTQLKEQGESSIAMDFNSDFTLYNSKGKINFSVELFEKGGQGNNLSALDKISKINSIVTQYYNSDFSKEMGKNYIRPPVMRTNAITKNKDLRQCLALWEYIESYEKIGYKISIQEAAEKPDEKYINELYSLLALQYVMFNYNVNKDFDDTVETIESIAEEVEPTFNSDLNTIETEDYNVYDSEYKRVVPISSLNKKLSESELRIRESVDLALLADKAIVEKEKAKEREKLRRERERIDRMKKAEAKRKAQAEKVKAQREAEKQRRKELQEKRRQERLRKKQSNQAKSKGK